MNIINLNVTNSKLLCTDASQPHIVAGSVGTYAVQFHFIDDIWADLTATAIFGAGSVEIALPICDKAAAYQIPHEVLAQAGVMLQVGILGVDGDSTIVVPTTYAQICSAIAPGANMDAQQGTDPTPSVYAQWVADVHNAATTATAAAATATAQATSAAQSVATAQQAIAGIEADFSAESDAAIAEIDAISATRLAKMNAVSAHPPILGQAKTWLVWDEAAGTYQDSEIYAQGTPFTYADFTEAQLAALKGEAGQNGVDGADGTKGDKGDTGEQGAPFTYADFTEAQLAALKGEAGQNGVDGADGTKGDKGDTGEQGAPGAQGNPTIVNGLNGESITLTATQIQMTGYVNAATRSAITSNDTIAQAVAKLEKNTDDLTSGALYAAHATLAETAEHANGATNATNAEHASTATTATNATMLGGVIASECSITTYTQSEETIDDTLTLVLESETTGSNGRFKATTTGSYGAALVNDATYTVQQENAPQLSIVAGNWYSFILDVEDATINFKPASGGSGMSLSVVGGETQPTNPTPNTIWVANDAITKTFSVASTAPSGILGDIWLRYMPLGTTILLQENVQLQPICVFANDGDEYIPSSAKYFNGNSFDTIPVLIRYNNTEYTDTITVDTASQLSSGNQLIAGYSQNSDVYSYYVTTQKINVTGASTLKLAYSNAKTQYGGMTFALTVGLVESQDSIDFVTSATKDSAPASGETPASGELSCSINGITGDYFVKVQLYTYRNQTSGANQNFANVDELYLL